MYHALAKDTWDIPPQHTKKVPFCINSKHKWSEFVMLQCPDPLFLRDCPCFLHAKLTISQLHCILTHLSSYPFAELSLLKEQRMQPSKLENT